MPAIKFTADPPQSGLIAPNWLAVPSSDLDKTLNVLKTHGTPNTDYRVYQTGSGNDQVSVISATRGGHSAHLSLNPSEQTAIALKQEHKYWGSDQLGFILAKDHKLTNTAIGVGTADLRDPNVVKSLTEGFKSGVFENHHKEQLSGSSKTWGALWNELTSSPTPKAPSSSESKASSSSDSKVSSWLRKLGIGKSVNSAKSLPALAAAGAVTAITLAATISPTKAMEAGSDTLKVTGGMQPTTDSWVGKVANTVVDAGNYASGINRGGTKTTQNSGAPKPPLSF